MVQQQQQHHEAVPSGNTPPAMTGDDALLYFAYGSMTNEVSMARRGLHPSWSRPATLQGYRLAFQLGGMANLVEAEHTATCHGVLHRVTGPEFEVLRGIEASYDVIEVSCMPYEPMRSGDGGAAAATAGQQQPVPPAARAGSAPTAAGSGSGPGSSVTPVASGVPVTARAFIVQPDTLKALAAAHPEWGGSLPADRYIRIITAGLRQHGADPDWMGTVAAQPCRPSRQPHEQLKVPVAPSCSAENGPGGVSSSAAGQAEDAVAAAGMTYAAAATGAAQAGSCSLPTVSLEALAAAGREFQEGRSSLALFAVGPKVVQVDVASAPASSFVENVVRRHLAGKQVAFHMCMMLYEPLLPSLHSPADVRPEHVAWAEDALVEFCSGHGFAAQQVGWVQDSDVRALSPAAAAAEVRDAAEALAEEDCASAAPETGAM